MVLQCPGSENLRTPSPSIRRCPECGEEVEIFSPDIKVVCTNCGFIMYNDIARCIHWCKYAKECVGEDIYRKLVENGEGEKRD
jgi:transposase